MLDKNSYKRPNEQEIIDVSLSLFELIYLCIFEQNFSFKN